MAKAQYEGMFLFPGGGEAEANVKRVQDMIEKQGGSILALKRWDERKLAYEVKKQKRGTYVLAHFTAPGAAITAITRDVNLSDDILRVLITDASHLTKDEMEKIEPQPIVVKEPFDRAGGFGGGMGGGFGGGYGDRGDSRGGDRGNDRPRRRDDESSNA